ncbi:MAG: SpoIIE family protein phosphatase [Desulfofustis sp.]|nr:SpoIIE family protein phosphatase [Desulfofustis sp.]
MWIQPKSLQQRTLLYTILPTFILLIALSLIEFLYVRNVLINQWGETIVSRLARSADQIEYKLEEPKKLLSLLQNDNGNQSPNRQLINKIADQIRKFEIVEDVIIEWPDRYASSGVSNTPYEVLPDHGSRIFQFGQFDISTPKYDERVKYRTISLISKFKGMDDETVGTIEVIVSFDDVLEPVVNASWWKTNKAYLLDGSYNVLITTGDNTDLEDNYPMRGYGTVNEFEQVTLEAIQSNHSGTVLGPGIPPKEVSGFYRLAQVPWTLVVTAPGSKVLGSIITMLRYYLILLIICITLILVFMRIAMNRVTEGIKKVSNASNDLASGIFGPPLEVATRDEIGELTDNFNKMARQLRHRLELKENIDLAREVQQSLLPQKGLNINGLDISGATMYSDETGGDYFDILESDKNKDKIGVVVGDVVGHGVGAALLMTTVRALVRSSFRQPGPLEDRMNDVNRLLFQDTSAASNFVTLFYLELEQAAKSLRWVRAGHDPALVINCRTREITELMGEGVALGADLDWKFSCNELPLSEDPQVILICSDGVFEATNESGESFGKQRVYQLLESITELESEKAVNRIIGKIQSFIKAESLDDDITVVVLKTG